jgi:HSP20 family protein
MMLQRWDPFRELHRMEDTVNRLWRGYSGGLFGDVDGAESWVVPLDVTQKDDSIIVHASMPGVNPDDIDLSIENNVLTIRGKTKNEKEHKEGDYLMRERRSGTFYRALRLPDSLDTDHARPVYENGVLTIAFPRMESKKAKQLKVHVAGSDKVVEGKQS